jgi:low temperature requirement protein LtrA
VANLFVVTIHAVQFRRSAVGDSARAIFRLAPTNFGSALLVLGAAAAPDARGYLWTGACLLLVLAVVRRREAGFDVRADHFAERHRLVVIIALGETVVATGVGAQGRLDEAMVLIALLLSVTLLAQLWWVYFGGDDDRGAQMLDAAPPERRARLALQAYGLGHFVHVAGLVLLATGIEEVVSEPTDTLAWRFAVTMSAGCATFLLAEAFFVRTLAIGSGRLLAVAAAVARPTAALGSAVAAVAEIAGLVVVAGLLLALRAQTGDPEESEPLALA